MKISPARTAAFDILLRIETESSYSAVLLPLYEASLAAADRGLCHELVLGTLRQLLYIDKVIDILSSGKKLDIQIRIALRMAIYQIKFLDKIPDHAAINDSVNLVQRAKKTSAKGFVNAVLRRFVREGVKISYASEIERISVETSHPLWLLEKIIGEIGIDRAEAFAGSNNQLPVVAFRVVGEKSRQVDELIARSRPSQYVSDCYILERYDQDLIELAEAGAIYFQDEASQMVAQSISIPAGGRFLDVCAAPGGKTTLVAQNAGKGCILVAGDLHSSRVEYLRDNCRSSTGDAVKIVQYDAESSLPFAEKSFDAVLVDAPCTGTGTIRHNPEIRYSIEPKDFVDLPLKQLAILRNASKMVSANGILTYSTCSIGTEENEGVCDTFLHHHQEFEKALPNVPGQFVTEQGFARTWPQRDNMDGFFLAAFRRVTA